MLCIIMSVFVLGNRFYMYVVCDMSRRESKTQLDQLVERFFSRQPLICNSAHTDLAFVEEFYLGEEKKFKKIYIKNHAIYI